MSKDRNYREILRKTVLEEAVPVHKYGHQMRLEALSIQIGEGMEYDSDVVFATVWLHDLGVFDGNRPSDLAALKSWDHVRYATQRTRELLARTDFPVDKIPRVIAAIEEHQPKDVPTSIEATIARDADILEQLGSIAVLRTAAKLGSDSRFLRFKDVEDYLVRQLEELPSQLRLPRSRELSAPREFALKNFLVSLAIETNEGLELRS